MINIALPKGRLGNKVFSLLEKIGYGCEGFFEDNRKLVFVSEENGVTYQLIKPSDVGVYVERGVCDIGIVGKDVLLESMPDVYELLDLKLGRCTVAIAKKNGYEPNPESVLKVATKYPNIAKKYYKSQNREIEIIKLNGSVELAAAVGLSDVIVDIVETGSTLKENDMSVTQTIIPDISARLIANKASYKFNSEQIDGIVRKLKEVL